MRNRLIIIALLLMVLAVLLAQQGQINQAVESAHAAQLTATQALGLASSSVESSKQSIKETSDMKQQVSALWMSLREHGAKVADQMATIAGLNETSRIQQDRIDYLETYSWALYRETVIAWVVAGMLGLVLIALLLGALVVFAAERRNRWPRFRTGLHGAIIMPIDNSAANRP